MIEFDFFYLYKGEYYKKGGNNVLKEGKRIKEEVLMVFEWFLGLFFFCRKE